MCKSKSSTMATTPKPRSSRSSRSSRSLPTTPTTPSTPSFPYNHQYPSSTPPATATGNSTASSGTTTSSSLSATLSYLRDCLPCLVSFSDLSTATNHFLSGRLSGTSWRCSILNHDAAVFQRTFRLPLHSDPPAFVSGLLSNLGKSHHAALARLLGASIAGGGDHIYLIYEFVPGASLSDLLRNPKNPNFTPLSTWMSRIQIVADLSDGLEYIHSQSGTIHNRIKSSAVIVTDPGLRAKICHFGSADLSGLLEESKLAKGQKRIEGTRGYMAPEIISGGSVSQQSDVYAFGVVLLELISGEEPVKFKFNKTSKEFERISLIETANKAVEEGVEGVRKWVDSRLRDSYPVEAAERLITVALRCVDADPEARPDMTSVAVKVSKIYLESKVWAERVQPLTDFSVSIAPR
ncbi:Protein kinase superfamily protein [Rhynchospora pubera]|uniref:Protein kinase superfamily protein n=1 Tax=Rhynchospora pubera TaxID=906938 RepID=A0AAV8F3Z1_9POAL|nr:Protein kinase superfamily protein [Rhynchospora pubera]